METAYAERQIRNTQYDPEAPYRNAHNSVGFETTRYIRSAWNAISRKIGSRDN